MIIVILFGSFQKVSISTFSRSRCALNPLSAHDWKWNEGMNVSIIRLMRLAWQRWQAWCVCWGKKELVPCRTVPLTHAHADTRSRVWWRRTERRQTGNWCNKRTRRRQGRKLCPCVLCRCGWMDNFYVGGDFINFSVIKAPPGSTTEVLFDWQKKHWSELQVTLKL